ncbi:YadA C-terminal domain-containing protein [Photobacterium sp. BZF1]|uniref:YadA C-terminal domain-containing protein n=1 Tax=Photobacterium sp. BZF1 TaxID=1904457 RepID=UPI00165349A2|nr:YadA C-terminal domain-containing protein [Photobacterium sp. BZF1]MBC7004840.1 YadA C-terminal domain-containing protein [Photobacterium sp. BZF1]
MKKSLIALSLVSVFAAGTASAASVDSEFANVNDILNELHDSGATIKTGGEHTTIVETVEGDKYFVQSTDNGYKINRPGLKGRTDIKVTADGKITHINGEFQGKIKDDELPEPVKRPEDMINDNSNAISDLDKAGSAAYDEIYKTGGKAVEDIYNTGSAVAAKSVANEQRIDSLETGFKDMAARQDRFEEKLNKMDKKMDGVMAGTHAVTNARPMVAGGQTAFGVGTGFAGSAQAVAVGVAHNFKDSAWSLSATTNVSTGSGVKTQISGGVGAHYVF